ncbi:MAG: hypothetical protein ACREV8_01990, partial [Gammaproteobacteria bacterium]
MATAASGAQTYLLTGKFARSNGPQFDIPVIGENPGGLPNCGRTTATGAMIPGMTPIYQGYRTTIMTTMVATPPITRTMFANPHGCISITGIVSATMPGAGGAFHIPTHAFSRPPPGMTLAVQELLLPNVVQIATSFQISGPPMSLDTFGTRPPNGTMNDGMNTARFRYFHESAWLTQTGRAGAMFTWCFGNPACTMVSQAMGVDKNGDPNVAYPVHQLIVKYTPGANRFGGTMSHVLWLGPHPSSIAATVGGVLQFLGIAGVGEQVTGRGYAEFRTHPVMRGDAFAMFMLGPVYVPQLMSTHELITTVMTPLPGTGSMATATRHKTFGFPFTTGTVLARNTGTDVQKNALVITLTGMGGDVVTAMGARNLSLVAGALIANDALAAESPGLDQIFLSETHGSLDLATSVALLAVLGAVRRRAPAH